MEHKTQFEAMQAGKTYTSKNRQKKRKKLKKKNEVQENIQNRQWDSHQTRQDHEAKATHPPCRNLCHRSLFLAYVHRTRNQGILIDVKPTSRHLF